MSASAKNMVINLVWLVIVVALGIAGWKMIADFRETMGNDDVVKRQADEAVNDRMMDLSSDKVLWLGAGGELVSGFVVGGGFKNVMDNFSEAFGSVTRYFVDPSQEMIVFEAKTETGIEFGLLHIDNLTVRSLLVKGDETGLISLAGWSKDGSWIVFTQQRIEEPTQVMAMDRFSGEIVKIAMLDSQNPIILGYDSQEQLLVFGDAREQQGFKLDLKAETTSTFNYGGYYRNIHRIGDFIADSADASQLTIYSVWSPELALVTIPVAVGGAKQFFRSVVWSSQQELLMLSEYDYVDPDYFYTRVYTKDGRLVGSYEGKVEGNSWLKDNGEAILLLSGPEGFSVLPYSFTNNAPISEAFLTRAVQGVVFY
jgi:hypothetical protein